jgi:CubicO group peptidase (beta-lactamase class C family)
MRYLPLPGQFRKTYAYSNFGYTMGAIAAATKVGQPWETIAEEQLYSRLGLETLLPTISPARLPVPAGAARSFPQKQIRS